MVGYRYNGYHLTPCPDMVSDRVGVTRNAGSAVRFTAGFIRIL